MRAPRAGTRVGIALAAAVLVPALAGCGEQNESVPADDQCQVAERVEDEAIDCPEE